MTVTITPLSEREFFAWYTLFAEYASGEGVQPTDEQVMRVWTTVQSPDGVSFVAHDGSGAVVGLVHALRFERLLTGRAGYEIEDLFVSPTARRQGVATALIEHVRTRAEADRLPLLRWSAKAEAPATRALQDKFAASAGGWVLQTLPVG